MLPTKATNMARAKVTLSVTHNLSEVVARELSGVMIAHGGDRDAENGAITGDQEDEIYGSL